MCPCLKATNLPTSSVHVGQTNGLDVYTIVQERGDQCFKIQMPRPSTRRGWGSCVQTAAVQPLKFGRQKGGEQTPEQP